MLDYSNLKKRFGRVNLILMVNYAKSRLTLYFREIDNSLKSTYQHHNVFTVSISVLFDEMPDCQFLTLHQAYML